MNMLFRFALTAALLVTVPAPFLRAQDKGASCGDLLAELHQKPSQLEFMSCSQHKDLQGKPFKATYRVPGTQAVAVENFLVQHVHLPRLKKSCCQWDGPPGYYNRGNDQFLISMVAEDNPNHATLTRAEWRKIPYFYVEISLDTEAP